MTVEQAQQLNTEAGRRFGRGQVKHQCGHKLRHTELWLAWGHARRIEELEGQPAVVYPCPHCGFMHVGRDVEVKRWRVRAEVMRMVVESKGFRTKAPRRIRERFAARLTALLVLIRIREGRKTCPAKAAKGYAAQKQWPLKAATVKSAV